MDLEFWEEVAFLQNKIAIYHKLIQSVVTINPPTISRKP